jgi:DNA-binding NtrC family response regulator
MKPKKTTKIKEKIRLLIVDDEAGYARVLANRMALRGLHVSQAYSGTEAIRTLRKNEFDVAVLDLKMEDMDGLEVLKIFKKMAPDLMVIMLTGHGSAQAASDGISFGAFDYLTKPCDFSELLEKIRKAYLKQKRMKNPTDME